MNCSKRSADVSGRSYNQVMQLTYQLRPRSAAELTSLLTLCEAATTIPHIPTLASALGPCNGGDKIRQVHDRSAGHISGAAHFVKSRHGPFYALMSVLSKLSGRKSPAYWDLYRELCPLCMWRLLLLQNARVTADEYRRGFRSVACIGLVTICRVSADTSGAIAALATAIDQSPYRLHARPHHGLAEDKRVLGKLRALHQRCFAQDEPSSPV